MTTECMNNFKVDINDEFRPRARTMSPSILRKMRPVANKGSPRVSSGRKIRRHDSVNSDSSSSEDLSSSPPQHNTPRPNSKNNQSLLISILKRSKQNSEGPLSSMEGLSGSLPELSTDKYIDDCILRASQESLTFDREPLPKGSDTFESVMHELGSEEDVSKPKEEKHGKQKEGNNGQKQGKGKSKGQNIRSSPDVHSRRVHWRKN